MSLDLSVTAWTIITFIVLMLFLNRFFFRPLKAFMRDRQARIEKGAAEGREAVEKQNAARAELDKALESARRKGLQSAESDVFQYRKDARGRLDAARSAADQKRETVRGELEQERKRMEEAVREKMPGMTETLACRLLKKPTPPQ